MTRSKILVVDDDESLRRVTQLQLEEAGYDVLTAADGGGAGAARGGVAALVITDLKMPEFRHGPAERRSDPTSRRRPSS